MSNKATTCLYFRLDEAMRRLGGEVMRRSQVRQTSRSTDLDTISKKNSSKLSLTAIFNYGCVGVFYSNPPPNERYN